MADPEQQPPLQIDIHELPSGVPAILAARYPTVTLEMPLGDYGMVDTIGNCILVERKAAGDLIASISDGRLKSQLDRLQSTDAPFLLVEGELRNHDGETDFATKVNKGRSAHSLLHLYRHSAYDYPYVLTLLVRTLYLTRIRVLWSQDKEGTAHLIGALYRSSLRWPITIDSSITYPEPNPGDDA